jgi:hypothetical protein
MFEIKSEPVGMSKAEIAELMRVRAQVTSDRMTSQLLLSGAICIEENVERARDTWVLVKSLSDGHRFYRTAFIASLALWPTVAMLGANLPQPWAVFATMLVQVAIIFPLSYLDHALYLRRKAKHIRAWNEREKPKPEPEVIATTGDK